MFKITVILILGFGKPEGRRELGRSIHRWKDNIKMGLKDITGFK
jgi:hypothetical protein